MNLSDKLCISNLMASMPKLSKVHINNCNSSVGIEMCPPKSFEVALIFTNWCFFSAHLQGDRWHGSKLTQVKEGVNRGRLSLGWVLWRLS